MTDRAMKDCKNELFLHLLPANRLADKLACTPICCSCPDQAVQSAAKYAGYNNTRPRPSSQI